MRCRLSPSSRRFYPQSPPETRDRLRLRALRGERVAFQVVCRTGDTPATIEARVEAPEGFEVSLRRVGYVPMPHFNTETPPGDTEGLGFLPGLVPDPLFPDWTIIAGPRETNSFWVTVRVGTGVSPGNHGVRAMLVGPAGVQSQLTVHLTVHDALLPERQGFPVTHWLYVDAITDWYQVSLFGAECWRLLDRCFQDLAEHGQDTIYVPIFTPPLEGVRRPGQLLGIERDGDRYSFDWSLVKRWLKLARAAGLPRFEWAHLFSQWGVEHALRIYRGHGEDGTLLWPPETPATSDTYRDFLRQFLPAFEQFLRSEGALETSLFHLSDEPHGSEHLANYRAARRMLQEIAPWMRVMDALSEVVFAREGVTDIPVALLPSVPAFADEGFRVWAYFCCQPRCRYLNRLFDTPLAKIRMTGWICYRTGVKGFLHWGYDFWYESRTTNLIDPFEVFDGKQWPTWPYGDPFVVYPGSDGPIDSVRWEVFAESLQDYALLQAAGIQRDDPLLAEIRDFADFPRHSRWLVDARSALLDLLV